jgi:hypothetical protein
MNNAGSESDAGIEWGAERGTWPLHKNAIAKPGSASRFYPASAASRPA